MLVTNCAHKDVYRYWGKNKLQLTGIYSCRHALHCVKKYKTCFLMSSPLLTGGILHLYVYLCM